MCLHVACCPLMFVWSMMELQLMGVPDCCDHAEVRRQELGHWEHWAVVSWRVEPSQPSPRPAARESCCHYWSRSWEPGARSWWSENLVPDLSCRNSVCCSCQHQEDHKKKVADDNQETAVDKDHDSCCLVFLTNCWWADSLD